MLARKLRISVEVTVHYPAYSYGVQRSTDLVDWVMLSTTNAPAGGVFRTAPASAYYRLTWTP